MRSYYEHLESATGKAPAGHPVYRSSAIFPVINSNGIYSRILFMGYWILKRNIQEIASVITLRDSNGKILHRENFLITEPKTYRIELTDQLEKANLPKDLDFFGSLEIEFFSTVHLVFPFPATVINYYGSKFSSVVHTAQRVYNDFEDMRSNSRIKVPESGFNIYAEKDLEPFISMINGPVSVPEAKIQLFFYNDEKKILTHTITLNEILPYQTIFIYPQEHLNLKEFLKGKPGVGKISFQLNWVFTRLVVGNIDRSLPAMSITHTFYDCSGLSNDSDYWMEVPHGYYQEALSLPLCANGDRFTNIYLYPIYSPAHFVLDLEIYDKNGSKLGSKKDAWIIKTPFEEYIKLDISKICHELAIDPKGDLALRIMARTIGTSRLPARIKLGVDIGHKNIPNMPCNICTNLNPCNPALETKTSTFRWSPILTGNGKASLWIHNASPAVNFQNYAEIKLSFYHEKDSASITRLARIPPHGFIVISPNEDQELNDFLKDQIGWCTAVSNNPYTNMYYLFEATSGVVGGDHSF